MLVTQPTILYVENDPQSRHVIEVLLIDVMGFSNLITFESSEHFLERLHQLPTCPDVMFLDIQMQPHDGYEMLTMLQTDPVYQSVPIIAMTASVTASDIDNLRQAGFSGLIGKPINRLRFPALVEQILAGESVWFVT